MLEFGAAPTLISLGDTLTGATSAATGVVIYVDGTYVGVTRATGQFEAEDVLAGATLVGTIADPAPPVNGVLDNALAALAAAEYRVPITAIPGTGPVRGLEILGSTLYAWRDNTDATELWLHKASVAGWVQVPMLFEVDFTAGSSAYAEGSTLTQGAVNAVVKRVVLQSGAWTGTAAGRLIVEQPAGGTGNFVAGAAAGGGACTLGGSASLIVLSPGGRVRTDVANFTASLDTKRIYGCDGVNREFELGDDILVPLTTGMGAVRAGAVRYHKQHLFFGFRGSVQHSSIATPYQWSAVSGAAELGTSDVVTDFVPVGGSADAAALMVLCENAVLVLYGGGLLSWNLVPLSRVAGAKAGTAQDAGGVMALDSPGVVRYPATQNFGNFAWDVASRKIGKIAAAQQADCSVFVPTDARYRVWFTDGTGLSGLVGAGGKVEWTTIDYGLLVKCAVSREMGGAQRTFIGDNTGMVYETDVGRSFAGEIIRCAARLNALSQRSIMLLKQYRGAELEVEATSATTIDVSAEFFDGDEDIEPMPASALTHPGAGLQYDTGDYDSAYYDAATITRKRVAIEGQGVAVAITISNESAQELPHTLRGITLAYSPLRAVHY